MLEGVQAGDERGGKMLLASTRSVETDRWGEKPELFFFSRSGVENSGRYF